MLCAHRRRLTSKPIPNAKNQAQATVNVATYNLLAPITEGSIVSETPEYVKFVHRWPLLQKRLDQLIKEDYILVLQEVDQAIEKAGLYNFLASRNYIPIQCVLCGPRKHGTVIAFPSFRFHLQAVGHEPIGLSLCVPPFVSREQSALGEFVYEHVYFDARRRDYCMPWVILWDWDVGQHYGIFGYQMICTLKDERKMTLHAEAIMRRAYELCGGAPFILAGDFNFLPASPLYKFMTTGVCDRCVAPCSHFSAARTIRDPLASVASAQNLVSNHTPLFKGRIDYIFTSDDPGWDLKSFALDAPPKPIPNEQDGSDHVPVACKFTLQPRLPRI
jgi:hypothetical protein